MLFYYHFYWLFNLYLYWRVIELVRKGFVSKINGYTLENEDDFDQGNKVEITNI